MRKKRIVLGTYKYIEDENVKQTDSCYGCHNTWNNEIIKNKLIGKELKVILEEK